MLKPPPVGSNRMGDVSDLVIVAPHDPSCGCYREQRNSIKGCDYGLDMSIQVALDPDLIGVALKSQQSRSRADMNKGRSAMLKVFAKITGVLLVFSFLTGCGAVSDDTTTEPTEVVLINQVLKNWREGYQNEDLDKYMSTYWEDGFLYTSDMGTKNDKTDDIVFNDIQEERDAAQRIFDRNKDIEIELSEPPEIQLNTDRTQAEVRNHYKIQAFVADGGSLEGGHTGWYSEGDNFFIFELRINKDSGEQEWRITEWHDKVYSEEEIRAANPAL